jgi:NNP family nitrate/nitrite transporter-like MFS transporter
VYAIGLLLGVAGASFAVALPMASRWYPARHQGLAMGIAGAGNSGTLVSTLCAPRLAEHLGWHAVFGLAMIPLAVVALVFVLFAREAPQPASRPAAGEFLAALRERDTWLFGLFYGVTFGGFVGLASYLSVLLRDQYGVSKVAAGDLTSLCVVAGSFLRPIGGLLADRLGGIRMLSVLFGALALLFLSVAQFPPLAASMVLFFVIMGCLGIGNGSVFQLVPQRFRQRVGVATGILGAAGGLGGFFLPTLLGSLRQSSGSYGPGLMLFAALAVLALVVLAVVQNDWIGVWIAKHGRVRVADPADSAERAEPA